jgi:Ergosterol biosynthesis ERG4/ERG24 family
VGLDYGECSQAGDPPGLGLTALWFGAFLAALFLGSRFLPGPVREGAPQPDGSRQRYRLNGLLLWVLLLTFVAVGTWLGVFSLAGLCRRFWALLVVANAFAVVLTLLLYAKGRRPAPGEQGIGLRRATCSSARN